MALKRKAPGPMRIAVFLFSCLMFLASLYGMFTSGFGVIDRNHFISSVICAVIFGALMSFTGTMRKKMVVPDDGNAFDGTASEVEVIEVETVDEDETK